MGNLSSKPVPGSCEIEYNENRKVSLSLPIFRVIGHIVSVLSLNVGCSYAVDSPNGFAREKFSGWQIRNRLSALKNLISGDLYTIVALSGIHINAVIHIKAMFHDLGYESVDQEYATNVDGSHWYIIGYKLFPGLNLFATYQYTFADTPATELTNNTRKTDLILQGVGEKYEQSAEIIMLDWKGEKIILAVIDYNSNFDYQKKCTEMLIDHLTELNKAYQVDDRAPQIIVCGDCCSYRVFERVVSSMFEEAEYINALHGTNKMPTYVSGLFDSVPDDEICQLCKETREMSDLETRKAFLDRCFTLFNGPIVEQFDHIFVKNLDQVESSIILPENLKNATELNFKELVDIEYKKSAETGVPFMVSSHLPCKLTFLVK